MKEEIEKVEIHGELYPIDHPSIVKDYISGAYILREEATEVFSVIELSVRNGWVRGLDVVFVHYRSLNDNLLNLNLRIINNTSGMNWYTTNEVEIRGTGRLHQSLNEAEAYVYYDDIMNLKHNRPDKFRPFNNQVKPFDDYNNPEIDVEDKKALIKRDFDYGVRSNTYKFFEGMKYTFGVELETSSGRLSKSEAAGLNLKCEFDGSLRETPDQRKEDVLGGEYITGVLRGDTGMFQLQKICNMLAKKCTINNKAGVHVHIGGINFTKENIVYFYNLGMLLQNEVYEMMPTSRRLNTYCRKIDILDVDVANLNDIKTPQAHKIMIDEYFNKIFTMVSAGKNAGKDFNKTRNHPMGSKCGYNKETQRYCWLNFVTAMFDTKGGGLSTSTLEFRNHSATLNYEKVKNWVKICFAFVNFVENHKSAIRNGYWVNKQGVEFNISLSTILMAAYPSTYKSLINYVDARKLKFAEDKGEIEIAEYKDDKEGIKELTRKETICA